MDPDACLKEIGEQLTHIGGEYDRALELIEALAEWIAGEGFLPKENPNAYNWEDVLVGAYWFCCDNHGGQWSDEYRIQYVISQVFQPGPCSRGPEPDSAELMVYNDLAALAGVESDVD